MPQEWTELAFVVARREEGVALVPAIKITFCTPGRFARYSFILGHVDEANVFTARKYLSDRYVHTYIELLQLCAKEADGLRRAHRGGGALMLSIDDLLKVPEQAETGT